MKSFRQRFHNHFHFDHIHWRGSLHRERTTNPGVTLADIQPGRSARITGFATSIVPERHAHLRSYGLVPGCMVRVIQHSPVTIIQVEHTELALEGGLAREVLVMV